MVEDGDKYLNIMEDYLKFTKEAQLRLSSYQKVHVVLGNETCDLDSAISAIVYSFFLYKTLKEESCLVVPVLNIPRKKYPLRTETTFLLGRHGISDNLLTFRDDLDLSDLHSSKRLTLTLVDHNVMSASDAGLEDAVTMVIDHRPRQRPEDDKVCVIIDTTGSCSTLIAEELLINNENFVMDHEVAVLLYGTILVDTINQSPTAGKTTPRDTAVIQTLEGWVSNQEGRELYDQLQKAKFNLSGLSNTDILEKDLKMVAGSCCVVAMASVSMEMQEFISRANFLDDCQEFVREKGATILLIMTLSTDSTGEPRRQLSVYSSNRDLASKLTSMLEKSDDPNLGLSPLPVGHDGLSCYTQGNVKASRKKVLPLVTDFCNTVTSPSGTTDNTGVSLENTNQNSVNSTENDRHSHVVPTLNFVNFDDDLGELNEADILESPRTPDVMVTGVNGCSGNSSATTSRPGSGYPSYPVTPPNSYMDGGFMGKEQTLPSFNSSEMLRKIQDKKASLSTNSGNPSCSGSAGNSVPYTPQNSVIDGGFDWFAKEQNLPSFNSSDMVQKIQQKRSSMGDNSDFSLGGDLMMSQGERHNDYVPFTPQNSYMESNKFNSYMDQSVDPGLLSSHLEAIKGHRSEVGSHSPEVRSHSPEVVISNQNNVTHSNSDNVTNATDNLKGDLESDQGQPIEDNNVVAMEIALAMLRDADTDAEFSESNLTFDRDDPGNYDNQGSNQGQNQSQDRGNINEGEGHSPQGDLHGERGKGSCDDVQEEIVFKEYVHSLAGQMIANAVEIFPNMSNPDVAKSIMGILQPSMGENSSYPLEMAFNKGLTFPVQLKKTPSSASITVETDYLSRIDPLHGNLDLATSGEKEVIECTSFRKISDDQDIEALQGKSWYTVIQDLETMKGSDATCTGDQNGENSSDLPKNFEASKVSEIPRNFESLDRESESDLPKNVQALRNSSLNNVDAVKKMVHVEKPFLHPTNCVNSVENRQNPGIVLSPCSGEVASLSAVKNIEEYASHLIREILATAIAVVTKSEKMSLETIDSDRLITDDISCSDVFEEKDQSELSDEMQELYPLTAGGSTGGNTFSPDGATCSLPPVDGASSDSSDSCSTTTEGSYRIVMSPDTENLEGQTISQGHEETGCENRGLLNGQKIRGLSTEEIEKWNDHGHYESGEMYSDHAVQNNLTKNVEEVLRKTSNHQLNTVDSSVNVKSVEGVSQSANISGENGCDSKGDNSSQINKLSKGGNSLANGAKSDSCHPDVVTSHVPNCNTDYTKATPSGSLQEKKGDNPKQKGKGNNSKHSITDQITVKSEAPSQSFQNEDKVVKDTADSQNPQTSSPWGPENSQTGKPAVSMTANSKDRLRGIEFSEEWQDDDIPGMPPTEEEDDDDSSESSGSRSRHSSGSSQGEDYSGPVRPTNLTDLQKKKKLAANANILTEDMGNDLDPALLGELEWENDTPIKSPAEPIPQYTAEEERQDAKLWRLVEIAGREQKIDLTVIEPFKRVLSHGGMTLPFSLGLKKNLKGLLLVHPTLWLKTIVNHEPRPFISSKFSSKLRFVRSLQELASLVPMEYIYVPDHVHKFDDKLSKHSPQTSPTTSDPAPLTPTSP
ncbi:uncharacterized protein [Argopecten irradians]|uniref:uncharacterized protein n=1 Tax=Argopecten irradians TaxID=31199 RepID=UPI003710B483